MSKTALLLVNMGGPSCHAEIEPYLNAIFSDPAILPLPSWLRGRAARFMARRRTPVVRRRYDRIGGRSPLPDHTERLLRGVRQLLDQPNLVVERAYRYTSPTIEQALRSLAFRGVSRICLLPLFPHHTEAMTGSIVREAERVAEPLGLQLATIAAWGHRTDVRELWRRLLLGAVAEAGDGSVQVLFVAHGIPMRNVRRGEDYPYRVAETAVTLAEALPQAVPWTLAYQSRVGPIAWTQPYLEDELERLDPKAGETLVLMPLSFVSDCLETQYDLDIVAAEQARGRGVKQVVRAPAFNDHEGFCRIVVKLLTELEEEEK